MNNNGQQPCGWSMVHRAHVCSHNCSRSCDIIARSRQTIFHFLCSIDFWSLDLMYCTGTTLRAPCVSCWQMETWTETHVLLHLRMFPEWSNSTPAQPTNIPWNKWVTVVNFAKMSALKISMFYLYPSTKFKHIGIKNFKRLSAYLYTQQEHWTDLLTFSNGLH